MKDFEPSQTAILVAMMRAVHQILDVPVVFEDKLALRIIGGQAQPALAALIEASRGNTELASLRAFLAARSRYAEERLACARRRSVAQCIILGAGLDTFAYRCGDAHLRIYEVDHPASQAFKKERLSEANIFFPHALSFVPVDLAENALRSELIHAGWNPHEPCIVSALGLMQYLTPDTTSRVLEFASSMAPGSEMIFDYSIAPHLMDAAQKAYFENLRMNLEASAEPLQSSFEPSDLVSILKQVGLSIVEHLSPEDLNARYFNERKDGLSLVTTLSHIVRACV